MLAKISHEFAQYVPWLTAIAVKASLLLLIALVTGQLLRRASAALRHVLYVATILGIVLLPLAAMLLPDLRVPILPPHSAGPASVEKMTPADIESMPNAIFPQSEITKSAQLKPHNRKSDAAIPAVEGAVALPRHAVSRSPQTGAPVSPQTSDWRGILVLVWIAGCAGCLLRMLVIQLQLGRLVKGSVPVDSIPLSSRLRWLCRDLGIK